MIPSVHEILLVGVHFFDCFIFLLYLMGFRKFSQIESGYFSPLPGYLLKRKQKQYIVLVNEVKSPRKVNYEVFTYWNLVCSIEDGFSEIWFVPYYVKKKTDFAKLVAFDVFTCLDDKLTLMTFLLVVETETDDYFKKYSSLKNTRNAKI